MRYLSTLANVLYDILFLPVKNQTKVLMEFLQSIHLDELLMGNKHCFVILFSKRSLKGAQEKTTNLL
jgi:hypothetical protein